MAQYNINLQIPLRENMQDQRPQKHVRTMMKIRKTIETTFSILCEHFALTKIKTHDLWHYTSKLTPKIIAYYF